MLVLAADVSVLAPRVLNTLSGGEKSRVQMARALAQLWGRRPDVGVVAVLHDLNLARRYADDVVVLCGGGAVHQGSAAQVLQPALIERVWSMPCQPVTAADGTTQYLFA